MYSKLILLKAIPVIARNEILGKNQLMFFKSAEGTIRD
jgi:hypothetical protein